MRSFLSARLSFLSFPGEVVHSHHSDSADILGKPTRRKGAGGRDLDWSRQASPVFWEMGDISSALGACLIYMDFFFIPRLHSIGCK